MLILTRKTGEVILIGDTVKIKIMAVQEGQVKVGIEAPRELKVYRAELYEQIQKQNAQAARISKLSAARAAELLSGSRRPESESDTTANFRKNGG